MTLEATRMALKRRSWPIRAGSLRPHEMIRKKMPDGTGSLQDLPMRAHGAAAEDEAADGEYCKAIDRVTAVFGKQKIPMRRNNSADAVCAVCTREDTCRLCIKPKAQMLRLVGALPRCAAIFELPQGA